MVLLASGMRETLQDLQIDLTKIAISWSVEILELALIESSSSLHYEACNALGASDGVIHSSNSLEVVSLRASTNIDALCIDGVYRRVAPRS